MLVPLQCEFYALEGVSHLVKTIERVRASYNPALKIQGIVLTMFDSRNNLSDSVELEVRGHFGDKVYETVIPRNVRVSEALHLENLFCSTIPRVQVRRPIYIWQARF